MKMGRKWRIFRSPFRNDPFGLKWKWFSFRLDRHINDTVKFRLKAMRTMHRIANRIGVPRDEEEVALLRKVVTSYDEQVMKLEEIMSHYRDYVVEGAEEAVRERNEKIAEHVRKAREAKEAREAGKKPDGSDSGPDAGKDGTV